MGSGYRPSSFIVLVDVSNSAVVRGAGEPRSVRACPRPGNASLIEAQLRTLLFVLILGCVVSSCTSTRFVGQDATVSRNDTLTYGETHRRLRTHSGRVYLTDGKQMFGDIDQVKADSVFIIEKHSKSVVAIPSKAIQRIEHTDRVGGLLGGLFGGTAGGFLAGAGVGALISAARNERTGIGTVVFAVFGASIGAFVGTVYGVSQGMVHVYQFREETVVHTSVEPDSLGTP